MSNTATKPTSQELQSSLSQFCGTEQYHRFSILSKLVITDGVKYLADKAGAFWFLDIIASYNRKEPFQVWTLEVTKGETSNKALVTMKEDTNSPVIITQEIEFTDFPLGSWVVWNIDGVILLPNEY